MTLTLLAASGTCAQVPALPRTLVDIEREPDFMLPLWPELVYAFGQSQGIFE